MLNDCDTSWKGEAKVSGWEVATGLGGFFPVNLLVLWVIGYSFFLAPTAIYRGFVKGLGQKGVLSLGMSKETLYELEVTELEQGQKITC